MAVTPTTFRAAFPAFNSQTIYPDGQIDFYLGLGQKLQNTERWGDLFDYGLQLFTAHHLSLDYASNKAGQLGQKPGEIEGPVTNGSVDKVSYGRDPSSALNPKDGHWNLTQYGIRYVKLIKMVGAGPMQAGVPTGGYEPGAWPGPTMTPPW